MNRTYFIIILTLGVVLSLSYQEIQFVPDKSINGICIFDFESLNSKIPNIYQLIDHRGPGAEVYLLNNQRDQLLTLKFHSGGNAYEVAEFKVEFAGSQLDKLKTQIFNTDVFQTESEIKLGMQKQNLIKIKGNNYVNESDGIIDRLIYLINDFETSDFLKEYCMPSYYATYKFNNDKLIEFEFGFVYP